MPGINVVLRAEQSDGAVSMVDNIVPAGTKGPFLHEHDFDEAFYVLEGELTFHLDGELVTVGAGGLAFAPGGAAHTFANRGSADAHYLIVCTPGGFEREFARRAARKEGVDPPEWALAPLPEVRRVGPQIGEDAGP